VSCAAFRASWRSCGSAPHERSCPACAEWAAGQRRASSSLARLAAFLDQQQPADRERALRAAFRSRQSGAQPAREWRWAWVAAAAGLTAAAVVLMVAARGPARSAAVRVAASVPPALAKEEPPAQSKPQARHSARRAQPRARTAESSPVPLPVPPAAAAEIAAAALAAAEAVLEVQSTAQGGRSPVELGPVPGDEPQAQSASADDRRFRPLLPSQAPVHPEDGQIVRVQLRVDVLDAAGVAHGDSAAGPLEAEVLVGRDGVARGVRLARPRR
jgi:hypothetical protein